jgi:hypothetical protein
MSNNFNDLKQSHLAVLNALARDMWSVLDRYEDSLPVASVLGVLEAIKYEVIVTAIGAADEEDEFDD